MVRSAGSYVMVWQIAPRHGRRAGLPSPKMRAKYGGEHGFAERRDPEKLGFIGDAAGWRWRCHRKHRLRFDEADVRRQLERHDPIYLDAA